MFEKPNMKSKAQVVGTNNHLASAYFFNSLLACGHKVFSFKIHKPKGEDILNHVDMEILTLNHLQGIKTCKLFN
jgi:hypothetical protein